MKKGFIGLLIFVMVATMITVPADIGYAEQAAEEDTMSVMSEKDDMKSDDTGTTEEDIREPEDVSDEMAFLYIESRTLEAPGTQNIAISWNGSMENISEMQLVYTDLNGNEMTVREAKRTGTSVLFTKEFSISEAGDYTVKGIRYYTGGEENFLGFDDVEIDASFSVIKAAPAQENVVNIEVDENGTVDKKEVSADIENSITAAAGGTAAKAAARNTKKGNVVVVIDPGHGGNDGGTVNKSKGLFEKTLTLKIAKYCRDELKKYEGIDVYMTRETDVSVGGSQSTAREELQARVDVGSKYGADLLISIHINAGGGKGAEIYYPNNNYNAGIGQEGKDAAQKIYDELIKLGLDGKRGIKILNHDGDEYKYPDGSAGDYYGITRMSKIAGFPGLVVEHAFIDNAGDAEFLKSESNLKKMGEADAAGIVKYFGLKKDSCNAPVLSSADATSKGTEIKWKSVSGASGYAVYRKVSGKDWSMIGTTTDTSFTDKDTLSSGGTYYYTVRAYRGEESVALKNKYKTEYWSDFDYDGLKTKYIAIPELKSATVSGDDIKVQWNSVSKADGYAVYRNISGNSWEMIGTTSSTSYTDKNLATGGTYKYTVRAYIGSKETAKKHKYSAQYWSGFDASGVEATYLTVPELTKEEATSGGTKKRGSYVRRNEDTVERSKGSRRICCVQKDVKRKLGYDQDNR